MKKIVLAAFAAAVAVPVAAAPGDTATTQGEATAEIVAPISIVHDTGASLNFGLIVAGTTGGTVVVDTADAGSVTGDLLFASGSSNSADSFTVSGDPDRAFTIELFDGAVDDGGSNSMNFTTTTDSLSVSLNGSGSYQFAVGGTLTVAANQPAGVYSGQYDVTVSYD
ncbi:DUF4402 domain-containing protein [Altererythrobacter sp. Z27]|uniref:DUF4402 domain-containing protein n=1 Tax=Altererythrobacter sp. Z27 TaxID=3461147 RepID=UPI0040448A28